MSKMRTCKICGKEYKCCKTPAPPSKFRWQDVACCPEHGAEYFKRVLIARGEESQLSEIVVDGVRPFASSTSSETKPAKVKAVDTESEVKDAEGDEAKEEKSFPIKKKKKFQFE